MEAEASARFVGFHHAAMAGHNHRTALGVTDAERTAAALKGIEGKRLTYRRIGEAAHA